MANTAGSTDPVGGVLSLSNAARFAAGSPCEGGATRAPSDEAGTISAGGAFV